MSVRVDISVRMSGLDGTPFVESSRSLVVVALQADDATPQAFAQELGNAGAKALEMLGEVSEDIAEQVAAGAGGMGGGPEGHAEQ